MKQRRFPRLCLLVLLVMVMRAGAVDIRGPHHPRSKVMDHVHHRPERDSKITGDSKLLRDAKHIQEDLLAQGAEFVDTNRMTPEELEFHYFKLHDYDNNTKLDGLEILQAINHAVLDHPGIEPAADDDFEYFVVQMAPLNFAAREECPGFPPLDRALHTGYKLSQLIDRVLNEDDSNGDGYLSYAEYVVGRGREKAKKKQHKPVTVQQHAEDVPAVE